MVEQRRPITIHSRLNRSIGVEFEREILRRFAKPTAGQKAMLSYNLYRQPVINEIARERAQG